MQNKELLKNFRLQIDTLDKEILYLLSRRFTIVNEIGKIKKEEKMIPLQENRWNELLAENIEVGIELGLTKDFVTDIWNIIHKMSLKIEK